MKKLLLSATLASSSIGGSALLYKKPDINAYSNLTSIFNRVNINKDNAKDFLENPNNIKFSNTTTVESFAFEGLRIPDGFIFPDKIRVFENYALSKTFFEGEVTLPNGIKFFGSNMFASSTFDGTKLILPNDILDLKRFTFTNTIWNNGAFLEKLPDSLEIAYGSTLQNVKGESLIPLSSNFSLENTNIYSIIDAKTSESGLFHNYTFSPNFKMPDSLMFVGSKGFLDSDFSNLNNNKLTLKSPDVYLSGSSGLSAKSNVQYKTQKRELIQIGEEAKEFLANPNDEKFKDYIGVGGLGFNNLSIPDGFVFPEHIHKFNTRAFYSATFEGEVSFSSKTDFYGNEMFWNSTFMKPFTLPESVTNLREQTFRTASFLNDSYLVKVPDNLRILGASSFSRFNSGWNETYSYTIPLSPDFTLENTKLEIILGTTVGSSYAGTFHDYKIPNNFKLPNTIKFIGENAFNNSDFSNLPNGKLTLESGNEVLISSNSGLKIGDNFEFLISDEQLIDQISSSDLPLPYPIKEKLPNSISKPNQGVLFNGVNYEFTKWDTNNQDGSINWEVTLTKGSATPKKLSGKLEGWQTQLEYDKKVLEEEIQNLKDFDGLDNSKQASDTSAFDLSWIYSKLQELLSHLSESQKALFIQSNISVTSRNNENGIISISISGHGQEKIINITGFQTNEQKKKIDDKKKIEDTNLINSVVESDLNLPNSDANIFASSLESWKNKKGSLANGVKYEFTKWDANDENGTIEWSVSLTFETGTPKVLSGIIVNFLTNAQNDINIVEEAIQNLNDLNIGTKDNVPSDFDLEYVFSKILEELDIYLTDKQMLLVKKENISFVYNMEKGYIEVTIKNYGLDKKINIKGYKTQDERDLESIIEADINNIINIDPTKMPSYISHPSDGILTNGVNYSFTSWIENDREGKISWTVSLSKGNASPIELSGIASGFLTKEEYDKKQLEVAIQNLNSFHGNDNTNQASNDSIFNLTWVYLKVKLLLSDLNEDAIKWLKQENISIISRNDETGIISIIISGHGQDKNLNIFGFQTNEEKKKIEDTALISAVIESDLDLPSVEIEKLPSEINYDYKLIRQTTSGVTYEFIKWITNNIDGTISWEAELSFETGTERIIGGKISGYQTIEIRSINLIKDALNAINSMKIGDNTKLPSNSQFNKTWIVTEVKKYLDQTFTSLNEGELEFLKEEYFITFTPQDNIGTINLKIIFHDIDKEFMLEGFQTQGEYDISQIQVSDFDSIISVSPDRMPSRIIYSRYGEFSSGVKYEFITWEENDANGTIAWEAKLTKNNAAPRIISGLRSGFLTRSEYDEIKLEQAIQELNGSYVLGGHKHLKASDPTFDKTFILEYLKNKLNTLSNSQLNLLLETDLSITINDEKGLIKIIIENHGPNKEIDLTGLLTNDQEIINDITIEDFDFSDLDKTKRPSENISRKDNTGTLTSGVIFKFIKWFNNDKEGKIEYTINLSKGERSRNLIGEITNFQTEEEYYLEALEEAIQNLNNIDRGDINNLPSKEEFSKTWVLAQIKYALRTLNKSILDLLNENDITISANDDLGIINVKINGYGQEKNTNITGFITNQMIIEMISQVTIEDILSLPQVNTTIHSSKIDMPENGITSRGLEYKFIKWETNDSKGIINWEVEISYKNTIHKRNMSGQLEGYKIKTSSSNSSLGLLIGLPIGIVILLLFPGYLMYKRIKK